MDKPRAFLISDSFSSAFQKTYILLAVARLVDSVARVFSYVGDEVSVPGTTSSRLFLSLSVFLSSYKLKVDKGSGSAHPKPTCFSH